MRGLVNLQFQDLSLEDMDILKKLGLSSILPEYRFSVMRKITRMADPDGVLAGVDSTVSALKDMQLEDDAWFILNGVPDVALHLYHSITQFRPNTLFFAPVGSSLKGTFVLRALRPVSICAIKKFPSTIIVREGSDERFNSN